jgi:hypothetical protein
MLFFRGVSSEQKSREAITSKGESEVNDRKYISSGAGARPAGGSRKDFQIRNFWPPPDL